MADPIPPLFADDKVADDTLVTKSAFFGNFCVASHVRAMWEWFHPYADADFVRKVRQGVQGLHDHATPGAARSDAYYLFHRCYWEMYVGCALLEQGITLVPRAQWDKAWGGAGPDLMAEVDGRRVWVECVAPGPGKGVDAVPELGDEQVNYVPVQQINLRLLSVFKDKREKYAGYVKRGIVRPEDGYVVAINAHGVPLAFLSDDPPWIARTLYGLGHHAVTYNLTTKEWSEAFLTLQPSISKQNKEVVDANLFGNGKAAEVSGVIYSAVDAWNPASSPARGILFVHNLTAKVPLPNRWLPRSVSYSVTIKGNKGTIDRADPEPGESEVPTAPNSP